VVPDFIGYWKTSETISWSFMSDVAGTSRVNLLYATVFTSS
jgi:hypothetical protein